MCDNAHVGRVARLETVKINKTRCGDYVQVATRPSLKGLLHVKIHRRVRELCRTIPLTKNIIRVLNKIYESER